MVCPKCRKKFDAHVEICPDCEVELVRELGSADAPPDETVKMQKITSASDDDFSPVLYRMVPENDNSVREKRIMAKIILAIGILFAAASIFFFIKGM